MAQRKLKPPKSAPRLRVVKDVNDLDKEQLASLTQSVLRTAQRAREDIKVFFEFVMRDFQGKVKDIRLAPHQEVGLEFVMAHDRSVCIWPVSYSKTFVALGLTLFHLGRNPEMRGAIVAATEEQAKKLIALVREYITNSPELRLVFPHLIPSKRPGDAWTQTSITIERKPGIKDASLTAYGVDSPRIIGSRLDWIIIDDVLNAENTGTKEQRDKVFEELGTNVLSRLDAKSSKVIVINTPWHPEDLLFRLRKDYGWATIRMDGYGDIEVWDDARVFEPLIGGVVPNPMYGKHWDSDLLRPKYANDPGSPLCRLVAHDPDPHNTICLWPELRPFEWLEQKKTEHLPVHFNQLYRCEPRDDASSMCKREYIDRCLKVARDNGVWSMVHEYRGPNITFTGIDLAFSPGEEHDDTAFFTFEVRPDGLNVILDVEIGQWDVPSIVDKAFQKHAQYKSYIMVENNGGQSMFRQWALKRNASLPIRAFHTTKNAKLDPTTGIPGLFIELANGAWAIPNQPGRTIHPAIDKWINACLYYVPDKHTFDVLMACQLGREIRKLFVGLTGVPGPRDGSGQRSVGTTVMSR